MTTWSRLRASRLANGAQPSRKRVLVWATLAGLVCGVLGLGQPLEDALRLFRNRIRQHDASGQIVVVGIDQRSLDVLGAWPWPWSRHAELVDRLNQLGARSITFDLNFSAVLYSKDEQTLAGALARSKPRVTLAVRSNFDPVTAHRTASLPTGILRRHADLASINMRTDYREWVWQLPYSYRVGERSYPTVAAKLAGVTYQPSDSFFVDFAVNPRSVTTVSVSDILSGDGSADRAQAGVFAGKDVIVGITAPTLGDLVLMPNYGAIPGVYLHVLGTETLRAGTPRAGGWLSALLAAVGLAGWAAGVPRLRTTLWALGAGTGLLLAVPLALDERLLFIDVVPALILLFGECVGVSWSSLRQSYRTRGTVNAHSGLLNLDALRLNEGRHDCTLIAARIGNYAQIAAALSADEEQVLVAQVARRLTIGSRGQTLYQGDEGIFAWFTPSTDVTVVGEHLDALQGFFRESLNVGDKQVDLVISFGVDTGSDRSPGNRLGSALIACEEAAAEGLKWKAFDPAALADASWKLSLLGQLDRAIDSGDFWVAYQPKLDLKSGLIVGAEALARWTHPVKGAIAPIDFILAAEQSDRIERLTQFVLDRAIEAAASINASGCPFNVAVNLSTRLIGDPALTQLIGDMLERHGLAAGHLTLEVTETAAMGTGSTNLETLGALRDLGIRISIDDYGTGLSTLEYLKKIPATEIKIDQSFVGAITRSYSDRLMVNSTIQLVHSLGHFVVAEGVEDQATLDALAEMGCDYAQGFFIGRPVPFETIADSLVTIHEASTRRIVNDL